MKKYYLISGLGVLLGLIVLFSSGFTPPVHGDTVRESKITIHLIQGTGPPSGSDTPLPDEDFYDDSGGSDDEDLPDDQGTSDDEDLPKTGTSSENKAPVGWLLLMGSQPAMNKRLNVGTYKVKLTLKHKGKVWQSTQTLKVSPRTSKKIAQTMPHVYLLVK